MTAYEFIQQHPEWVKDLETPRREIEAQAARYVRERDGSRNFNALITEDIEILLFAREAILLGRNVTTSLDIIRDFANVIIDSKEITEADNIIIDDGAKRQARVYAIFIKAIIAELNGKAICAAAQIQEWRERYGVKLEGLQGKSKKKTKEFEPIGLDEERAIRIYNWAFRSKRIECTEDDFIWYFGKKTDRTNSLQPNPIKWNGKRNELAYLCGRCADFTKSDKKEYITDSLYVKSRKDDTKWKGVYAAIFGLDKNERIRTQRTLSRIKRGSDNAPGCWNEIDALFK